MRTDLTQRNTTVPGWDNKLTQRPTAYMMAWKFKGILILCMGRQRRLAKALTRVQEKFLEALHVPQNAAKLLYSMPSRRIMRLKKNRLNPCKLYAECSIKDQEPGLSFPGNPA